MLSWLSPEKKTWVSNKRKRHGQNYEISYKQFILKTASKEVIDRGDSVFFSSLNKELFKQELQLLKTVDGEISDCSNYIGYDGEIITRREVKQGVLDQDNEHHHLILEAQEELKKDGKYIVDPKSTSYHKFLNTFAWTEEERIRALEYFTEFMWRGIISLEKDKSWCHRFLISVKDNAYTYPNNNMFAGGSLFVARDLPAPDKK